MSIEAVRLLLGLGLVSREEATRMLSFPGVQESIALEIESRQFEFATVLQPDGTRRWKELGEC